MKTTTTWTAPALVRVGGAAVLAAPVVLAFTVPPLGFLATLLLPLVAARARSRLWPQTSSRLARLGAVLAVIGLWLPAILGIVSEGRVGSEATAWLVMPLCAPTGAALLVPAACGIGVYLVGLTIGAIVRSPWAWVVGAWAAPLAYSAAGRWLVDFVCLA